MSWRPSSLKPSFEETLAKARSYHSEEGSATTLSERFQTINDTLCSMRVFTVSNLENGLSITAMTPRNEQSGPFSFEFDANGTVRMTAGETTLDISDLTKGARHVVETVIAENKDDDIIKARLQRVAQAIDDAEAVKTKLELLERRQWSLKLLEACQQELHPTPEQIDAAKVCEMNLTRIYLRETGTTLPEGMLHDLALACCCLEAPGGVTEKLLFELTKYGFDPQDEAKRVRGQRRHTLT